MLFVVHLAYFMDGFGFHPLPMSLKKTFLLLIGCLGMLFAEAQHDVSVFKKGLVDLHRTSMAGSSITLEGFWEFYPQEFVSPNDHRRFRLASYIKIPTWWKEEDRGPKVHFATYRLRIILSPDDRQRALAFQVPDVYTAYQLKVNGKTLGSNGQVGKTAETTTPHWQPSTYAFTPEADTLEVMFYLANFHHYRTGTAKPIVFGDADTLMSFKSNTELSNTLLFWGLCILAIGSSLVYLLKLRHNLALLYFAGLCLAWAFRSVFSNHYLFVQWFPEIPWTAVVKIEYLTLFASTLFGGLVLGAMFPRDTHPYVNRFFTGACLIFAAFTFVTPPLLFTSFVQVYLAVSSALLIYILGVISKAFIESRHGVSFLIVCALLGVVMFGYVIASYQGFIPYSPLFFNIGFLALFLCAGVAIFVRVLRMDTRFDYDTLSYDEITRRRMQDFS